MPGSHSNSGFKTKILIKMIKICETRHRRQFSTTGSLGCKRRAQAVERSREETSWVRIRTICSGNALLSVSVLLSVGAHQGRQEWGAYRWCAAWLAVGLKAATQTVNMFARLSCGPLGERGSGHRSNRPSCATGNEFRPRGGFVWKKRRKLCLENAALPVEQGDQPTSADWFCWAKEGQLRSPSLFRKPSLFSYFASALSHLHTCWIFIFQ